MIARSTPFRYKKIVDVFGRPTGDDRQDVQIFAVVDDPRDFCGEADRRAFEQAAGESDRPSIDPLSQSACSVGTNGRGGEEIVRAVCPAFSTCGRRRHWSAQRERNDQERSKPCCERHRCLLRQFVLCGLRSSGCPTVPVVGVVLSMVLRRATVEFRGFRNSPTGRGRSSLSRPVLGAVVRFGRPAR